MKKVTIKTKLLLVIILMSLVPLTVITVITLSYTRDMLKNEIGNSLKVLARNEAQNIQLLFKKKIRETELLASEEIVLRAVKKANLRYKGQSRSQILAGIGQLDQDWIKNKAQVPLAEQIQNNPVTGYIRNLKRLRSDEIGEIFITDAYGAVIAMTQNLSDYYQGDEQWWQASWNRGRGKVFLDDRGYDKSAGEHVVGIVVPILDRGDVIGVFKINHLVKDILGMVSSSRIGKSDFAFLVRSQGTFLSHSDGGFQYSLSPKETQALDIGKAGWREDLFEGRDRIFGFAPINIEIHYRKLKPKGAVGVAEESWEPTTWYLFNEINRGEVFETLDEIVFLYIIIVFIVITFILFFAYILSNQIFSPLSTLTKVIENVRLDGNDPPIYIRSDDEIGVLNLRFNEMFAKLSQTYQSLKDEIRERQLAEKNLLKSQVELENKVAERTFELQGAYHELKEEHQERILINAALSESEKYLRKAQSMTKLGNWKLCPETFEMSGSDEFYNIFEINKDQFEFESFAFLIHPEDMDFVLETIKSAMNAQASWKFECRLLMKDGRIKYIQSIGEPVFDEKSGKNQFVGTLQDITERKKTEIALKESEEKFRAILDNSNTVVYLKDTQGKFIFVNKLFEITFKVTLKEVIGKTGHVILSKESAESIIENDETVIKNKKPSQFEEVIPLDDGPHTYITSKFPLFDFEGKVTSVCSIALDITEKMAYDALKQNLEELELFSTKLEKRVKEEVEKNRQKDQVMIQQSRYAQMGELISMIAHQWRQPLNAISTACIELKLADTLGEQDTEKRSELSHFIEQKTQQMSQIINDFMNFFQPEKEKKPFLFFDLYTDLIKMIGPQLKSANIDVEFTGDKNLTYLGFKKELEQVMINLLANSRDAYIEKRTEKKLIKVSVLENKKHVSVWVEDEAGGISPEIIERIFEPYFTSKEQGQGTGLGLYMSKVIIEKSFKGTIEAKNTEKGTLFTLSLPK
ncbi:MAG: PAS domain S-box protein [Deltaproteobacteria bacterium]|nr:PAS domain S-box protein [Deltaproteobacteria bacterium]